MKIVLLSDLHITEQGFPIWNTDTLTHFNVAVEKITHINDIDAILVSGDVADKGSEWAYQYVYEKLDNLNIPCYYIPGNHDNVDNFKHCIPSSNAIDGNSVVVNDWNFILLDSTISDPINPSVNMSRGYLEEDKLSYLKREIELCQNKNICIVLHHPPIVPGGWLNRKLLENKDDFRAILEKSNNVKIVLFGHTHYHSIDIINGIQYICAPSVGFAFNKDLPKFQIDRGAEGFLVIELNGNCVITKQILINE